MGQKALLYSAASRAACIEIEINHSIGIIMFDTKLTHAVENFAALILPLSENDLERTWIWKDHDEEGIRFACFVTLQELRHLAVELSALHPKPTSAQHILSQYHAVYMDLQAAICGLSEEDADKIPAEGEWQVRRVYAHILSAEINFTITVRYALENTAPLYGLPRERPTKMNIGWLA